MRRVARTTAVASLVAAAVLTVADPAAAAGIHVADRQQRRGR